jgi:hypothetical protein
MKAFLEITQWGQPVVNHVYFMDDAKSRAYAYVKFAGDKLFEFKSPLKLDVRGRKFQEVPNTWGYEPGQAAEPEGRSWTVAGSKGAEYTVTELNGQVSCTCPGHKFRGTCKHTLQSVG